MRRRCLWSAFGPLLPLNFRFAGNGAATGQPGRARRLGSAVFAALRRPCAARVRGPVAQLATLTSFAALEQSRRVRARSALRARAPAPVLLGASHAHRARPGCPVAEPVVACRLSNTDAVAGKAAGGAWAGRIGAAEEHRASGRAPWRASSSDSSRSVRAQRTQRTKRVDATGQKTEHRRDPEAQRRASRLSPAQAPPAALLAPMQARDASDARKQPQWAESGHAVWPGCSGRREPARRAAEQLT